ncbi:bifunctional adenosylcobinamide kinase/adenosylcobinamide-phosphate guanylyltransferase [Bacillus sp. DJP31]|uniref:bifunctional adenosylcobinamide kinase/adenosylcobinamide-phosphate guanylyltransferase n=1 Tax=Bacillus sp. DJP31 TaxID=3409789 RepID=UPI003BB51A2C
MYLVTGGAFQGKQKWVKQLLLDTKGNHLWIDGYRQQDYSVEQFEMADIVVIEGMEDLIREQLDRYSREYWNHMLVLWRNWEKQNETNKLIIIGCEIGLGVVPMNKEDRLWRDVVGWVYQDIAGKSDIVVRVWCGLAETLKEEK